MTEPHPDDTGAGPSGAKGPGDCCPRCGSTDVVSLVRGLPAPDALDNPQEGVEYIGCAPGYVAGSYHEANGRSRRCGDLFFWSARDDEDLDDDDEVIEIPEDATQEELDAILMDGARPVSDEEMGQFFSWVAEGIHSFVRTLDDPAICIYCGRPESFNDHVPATANPTDSHDRT